MNVMQLIKQIKDYSYRIGITHFFWHCFIAGVIMGLVTLVFTPIFGLHMAAFAGCLAGVAKYWGREIAQMQLRGGSLEVMDAVYPTITNTILFLITLLL